MKFEITMTTGWIAAEPVEIPDAELAQLWQAYKDECASKGWGEPDRAEWLHELLFVRFEQPLQDRLEAVKGISSIDFQESIIRGGSDEDGIWETY